jgi:hypothetical protein
MLAKGNKTTDGKEEKGNKQHKEERIRAIDDGDLGTASRCIKRNLPEAGAVTSPAG